MSGISSTVATMPAGGWVPSRGVVLSGLERLRKSRLLTQVELADVAGVGRGTVIRAEKGLPVDLAVVRKLAEALDVQPAALLSRGKK